MSNDSRKPSRKELLQELESIRASLLPESGEEKPGAARETMEKAITQERPAITEEEIEKDIEEYEYSLTIPSDKAEQKRAGADDTEMADNAHQEKSSNTTKTTNEKPMTVLPGQQSLFDDNDTKPSAHNKTAVQAVDKKSVDNTQQEKPKTNSENPFLPKHSLFLCKTR